LSMTDITSAPWPAPTLRILTGTGVCILPVRRRSFGTSGEEAQRGLWFVVDGDILLLKLG